MRLAGLLPEHGGDLLPAVNSPQPDLPARHEAEKQHDGRVLARQGAFVFLPAVETPREVARSCWWSGAFSTAPWGR